MKDLALSFGVLLAQLQRVIGQLADPRQSSNGQRYKLQDVVLAAFSVFFMQCASFLSHQRQMQSRWGGNNASTLFGLRHLPSDPQIRNVLDEIAPHSLYGIFDWVYQALSLEGYLASYKRLDNQLLIALDGTQYFHSRQIHCEQCSHREHQDGTMSYFHSAILPVIVAPDEKEVISLAPEFITPQDGQVKQDCEVNAAKRWIHSHAATFKESEVTYLGDDLYSHQPMCESILSQKQHFIFNCLPDSHWALYESLGVCEKLGEVYYLSEPYDHLRTHQDYHYRYAYQMPLRDSEAALLVNWCEVRVIRREDGKLLYHNSWVTDHYLDDQRVREVVGAGRSRWKTENENNNVLKTRGYHLEHNFGHGQRHLSKTLLTLNIIAFLFHTVLQIVDNAYQEMRQKRGARQDFFQDVRTLTQYCLFESWQSLLNFMLTGEPKPYPLNSS